MIKRSWKRLMIFMMMVVLGLPGSAQFTSDFFAKHVAIVDASERSISEREYVRQIRIKIFDGAQTPPVAMGNEEYGFVDDGKQHDLVAGDGIYTTVNSFPHTEQNPYNEERIEKSVLAAAIINTDFGHREELQEFLKENTPPGRTEGLEISLECDVTWCTCTSKCGGCTVKLGSRSGCVPCPKFSDCKLKVTWSPF